MTSLHVAAAGLLPWVPSATRVMRSTHWACSRCGTHHEAFSLFCRACRKPSPSEVYSPLKQSKLPVDAFYVMDLPVSWDINRDLILSKRKNLLALLHPDRAEAPKDAEAHFQTVSNSSKTLLHDVSRAKHILDLGWGRQLLAEGSKGETLVDPVEMLEIMEVADQIPSLDAVSLADVKQVWNRRHLTETERTHSKIQHLIDVTASHVKNLELLPCAKDDAAITSAVDEIEISAGRMQFINRIIEACAKRERQIEGIDVD